MITGDFIKHDFLLEGGLKPEQKWETVKQMLSNQTQYIASKFPGIPILPAFGNNDMMENYIIPGCSKNFSSDVLSGETFFTDIYKIWFEDIPANLQNKSDEEIE